MKTEQAHKQIEHILQAETIDMGGFQVKQALPKGEVRMADPFLLLHHAKTKYHPLKKAIQQGIGPHPHRGFSPVTFVIQGEIHHRDSMGNSQVASAGEVQWMNAGSGVIHSERPSTKVIEEELTQEVIQLWINTPSSHKMVPPGYKYLSASDMPVVMSTDGLIKNKLVAGSYREMIQTHIRTQSELMLFWSEAKQGGSQALEIKHGHQCLLYLVSGELTLNGQQLSKEQLVVLNRKGSVLDIQATVDSNFLLFTGKPIKERVFQHGPFVMNTKTEILEAMRDYQMGKMGYLVEE